MPLDYFQQIADFTQQFDVFRRWRGRFRGGGFRSLELVDELDDQKDRERDDDMLIS